MRGISLGAIAATAALLVASPAHGHTTEMQGDVFPSGAITVTWHGDPARGCAAAGLCGYSGSVGIQPTEGSYDFFLAGGQRLRDSFSYLDTSLPAVVRVKRLEGNEEAVCVDVPSEFNLELTTARAGPGRGRLGFDYGGLTTGRCAGPDLEDVLRLLPRHAISLFRLRRAAAHIDMSGEARYASGRFSGVVRSTVRLRLGASGTGGGTETTFTHRRPPRDRRPRVRIVHLHSVYRVQRFAGSLSASFGGLTEPPCADLDACGLSGTSTWAIDSSKGRFAFDAYARARRGDHGVRGAFAAMRRGRALVFGDGGAKRNLGTTTTDLTRPGGAPCHDTARAASPGFDAFTIKRGRVDLELGGDATIVADRDLLRTGCPGPRDEDMLQDVAAEGSLPAAALARRSISARLRLGGKFEAAGYAGSRAGDFTVLLRRVSARADYRRVRGGV
jgi:hypothetical protein